MQNRLAEVVQAPDGGEVQTAVALEGQDVDVEMAPTKSADMTAFFADAESIKETIAYVRQQTSHVKALQDKAINAIRSEESNATSEELDQVLNAVNQRCGVAKATLAKMRDRTNEMAQKGAQADVRIRRNMINTLGQDFVAAVRMYQEASKTYEAKMKEKVARQVRVVKPDASLEDIDTVMRTGDHGAVYRAQILGNDPVEQAYRDVASKYQDVLRLEQSVRALNQLFQDLAMLVEQQGEFINSIEHNVTQTSEHVKQGKQQLHKAQKAQQSARKKYLIIAAILIIVLVIIVILVLPKS